MKHKILVAAGENRLERMIYLDGYHNTNLPRNIHTRLCWPEDALERLQEKKYSGIITEFRYFIKSSNNDSTPEGILIYNQAIIQRIPLIFLTPTTENDSDLYEFTRTKDIPVLDDKQALVTLLSKLH